VGKGTGLGLSISYGIVKECGGTIDAVPDVPHGTCFVLKFPLIKATNASTVSIDRKAENSHE
jgi:signal transduction histidine kinase